MPTTNKRQLISRVLKTEAVNWRNAKWLQNDDLKDINDEAKYSLKLSLVNNKFVMPFHVWYDEAFDTIWILDGKHRKEALIDLAENGIEIDGEHISVEVPDLLPATFLDCQDKKEAAKLVLIYSSAYAKINQEGLNIFLELNEIDLSDIRTEIDLPDFSFDRFEQKYCPPDIDDTDDEIIEETGEIVVQEGDIFQLGDHLLYCADGMKPETWEILLQGKKVRTIFTDPPFNLPANYISNLGKTKHEDFAMGKGEMSEVEFKDWLQALMEQMCAISVDGAIHYICMDWRHVWHMTEASLKAYGSMIPKQLCVWNKSNGANGSFYRAKHELIFVFKHGTAKHVSKLELKDRYRTNMWEYPSGNSYANPDYEEIRNHPTPKPVQMVADALLDVTNEGDLVADFFLGSGTTLIAADKTGRISYNTEIEPKYCQSVIRRYFKHCIKSGKDFVFKCLNREFPIDELKLEEKYG